MKKTLLSIITGLWAMAYVANAQTSFYGVTGANAVSSIANVAKPSFINGPYAPSEIFNFANSADNDLLVYPNPVAGYTHIVLPSAIQAPVFVDIIDLNGNVERSFQYTAGSNILDVDMSRMPTGLYSVRVYGKYIAEHNLKVVKE